MGTFPALRQDVQTCIRVRFPLMIGCTVWMLGSQRRLVRRCEWLSCLEKYGDFPQISQVAGMDMMVAASVVQGPDRGGAR